MVGQPVPREEQPVDALELVRAQAVARLEDGRGLELAEVGARRPRAGGEHAPLVRRRRQLAVAEAADGLLLVQQRVASLPGARHVRQRLPLDEEDRRHVLPLLALGDDAVSGGLGDDSVYGGIGNDTLDGGSGNDTIRSDEGDDLFYGGIGDDLIAGGAANDVAYGQRDHDVIYGNTNDDLIYGNQQNDTLYGGQNNDTVFGGQDEDAVFGNKGDDAVYGNKGDDVVFGGQGSDVVYGGQGNDTVEGNLGDDSLYGNLGGDVFAFGTGSGSDIIYDFTAGADMIQVASNLNGLSVTQASDLTVRISDDSSGNAVIDLGDGNQVTVIGVSSSDMTASISTYIEIV